MVRFFRNSFVDRLFRRLLSYSGVGIFTYLLDIAIIIVTILAFDIEYMNAVAYGFLIGVTLNYLLCYFWVYRGTERNFFVGLLIFVTLAAIGVVAITYTVGVLVEQYRVPLLIARTLIACAVGLVNFGFNTFFNFKLA